MVNTQSQSTLQPTLATNISTSGPAKRKPAGIQNNADAFASIMSPLVQQANLSSKTPSAMAQANSQLQKHLPTFSEPSTSTLSNNSQIKEIISAQHPAKPREIDSVQNTLQRRALQQSKLQPIATQQSQPQHNISDLRAIPSALPPAQRRRRSSTTKNYDIGMEDTRSNTPIRNKPLAQKRRTTTMLNNHSVSKNAAPPMNFSYEKIDFDAAYTTLTQQLAAGKENGLTNSGASHHLARRASSAAFGFKSSTSLGMLTAKFESGSEGIAAIGYDRTGGTSYGKYQISSKAGTMQQFISFLKSEAPDLAKRLQSAGPANTGNRQGSMPATWRKIAAENPARFESLQEKFIHSHHFEPALQHLTAETGINFKKLPLALQEVLFSTAVQHGPVGAVRIINRAIEKLELSQLDKLKQGMEPAIGAGKALIKNIYAIRSGQFSSSTPYVQMAARNRLQHEMNEALELLTT